MQMNKFRPEKLRVRYGTGVTLTEPIIPRRYTVTHSNETGELFLTVASEYDCPAINRNLRDEVLASWVKSQESIMLRVTCYISGGEFDYTTAVTRYGIFQRKLPLVLKAIRYGDRATFQGYPRLDKSPIYIQFDSIYPAFRRVEYWGTPSRYRRCAERSW